MADHPEPFPSKLPRPPVYDHQNKRKKPRRETVYVYLDDDAVDAYHEARTAAERAVFERDEGERRAAEAKQAGKELPAGVDLKGLRKSADEALRRESEARDLLSENTASLMVAGIPNQDYEELVRDHPPTEEDHEEHRRVMVSSLLAQGTDTDKAEEIARRSHATYNDRALAPPLIAACLVEPKMTPDEVAEMLGEWNKAEVSRLLGACLRVNEQVRVVAQLEKAWG